MEKSYENNKLIKQIFTNYLLAFLYDISKMTSIYRIISYFKSYQKLLLLNTEISVWIHIQQRKTKKGYRKFFVSLKWSRRFNVMFVFMEPQIVLQNIRSHDISLLPAIISVLIGWYPEKHPVRFSDNFKNHGKYLTSVHKYFNKFRSNSSY